MTTFWELVDQTPVIKTNFLDFLHSLEIDGTELKQIEKGSLVCINHLSQSTFWEFFDQIPSIRTKCYDFFTWFRDRWSRIVANMRRYTSFNINLSFVSSDSCSTRGYLKSVADEKLQLNINFAVYFQHLACEEVS